MNEVSHTTREPVKLSTPHGRANWLKPPSRVLRLADRALYTAKSNGRNRIETINVDRRANPPKPRAPRTRKAA